MGFPTIGLAPSAENSSTANCTVRDLAHYKGDIYRYMRAEDGAWANGDVLAPADATGTEASWDRSGGTAISATITYGIAVGTVTDAYYGWMLVSGFHSAIKTEGNVAAGNFLVMHSVDKQCIAMSDGEEEQVFGFALADDSSAGTVAAMVRLL